MYTLNQITILFDINLYRNQEQKKKFNILFLWYTKSQFSTQKLLKKCKASIIKIQDTKKKKKMKITHLSKPL